MRKLLFLLSIILLVSCGTTNEIVIKGDNSGYMVTGKDTTLLSTEEVVNIKELMKPQEDIFRKDILEAMYSFDTPIDTTNLSSWLK